MSTFAGSFSWKNWAVAWKDCIYSFRNNNNFLKPTQWKESHREEIPWKKKKVFSSVYIVALKNVTPWTELRTSTVFRSLHSLCVRQISGKFPSQEAETFNYFKAKFSERERVEWIPILKDEWCANNFATNLRLFSQHKEKGRGLRGQVTIIIHVWKLVLCELTCALHCVVLISCILLAPLAVLSRAEVNCLRTCHAK